MELLYFVDLKKIFLISFTKLIITGKQRILLENF